MKSSKEKPPTMRSIAKEAGISPTSVSLALADSPQISAETKSRVLHICDQVGYKAKKRLSSRVINQGSPVRYGLITIGTGLKGDFTSTIAHFFATFSAKGGFRTEISTLDNIPDIDVLSQQIISLAAGVEGIVLTGLVDPSLPSKLQEAGVNYVLIGSPLRNDIEMQNNNIPLVDNDGIAMGRLAVGSLLAAGHKRVGFLYERMFPGLYNAQWHDGLLLAHYDFNIGFDSSLSFCAGEKQGNGRLAAEYFLAQETCPSAFVILEQHLAAPFLEQMSVAGQSVGPENVVLSGRVEEAELYQLEQYPLLTMNFNHMVSSVLELLGKGTDNGFIRQILIPHEAFNMERIMDYSRSQTVGA